MSRSDANKPTLHAVLDSNLEGVVVDRLRFRATSIVGLCSWRLGDRCDIAVLLRNVAGSVGRVRAELVAEAHDARKHELGVVG